MPRQRRDSLFTRLVATLLSAELALAGVPVRALAEAADDGAAEVVAAQETTADTAQVAEDEAVAVAVPEEPQEADEGEEPAAEFAEESTERAAESAADDTPVAGGEQAAQMAGGPCVTELAAAPADLPAATVATAAVEGLPEEMDVSGQRISSLQLWRDGAYNRNMKDLRVGETLSVVAMLPGSVRVTPTNVEITWQRYVKGSGKYEPLGVAGVDATTTSFIVPASLEGYCIRCLVAGKTGVYNWPVLAGETPAVPALATVELVDVPGELVAGATLVARATDAAGTDVTAKASWQWRYGPYANTAIDAADVAGATSPSLTITEEMAYLSGCHLWVRASYEGTTKTSSPTDGRVALPTDVELYRVRVSAGGADAVEVGARLEALAEKRDGATTTTVGTLDRVSYQWQYATTTSPTSYLTSPDWTDIDGATTALFEVPEAYPDGTSAEGTRLRVVATSGGASVVSTRQPYYGDEQPAAAVGPVVARGARPLVGVRLEAAGDELRVDASVRPVAQVAGDAGVPADVDGAAQVRYAWQVADATDGPWEPLADAAGEGGTLTVDAELAGRYVRASAFAHVNTAYTEAYLVSPADGHELVRVTLAGGSGGQLVTGDVLMATAQARTLNSGVGDGWSGTPLAADDAGVSWQWYVADDAGVAAGAWRPLTGATSARLVVPATAVGRHLRVVATSGASARAAEDGRAVVDASAPAGVAARLDAAHFAPEVAWGGVDNVNDALLARAAELGIDVDGLAVETVRTEFAARDARAEVGVASRVGDAGAQGLRNGDVTFFWCEPSELGLLGYDQLALRQVSVTYRLTRGIESVEYTPALTALVPWDEGRGKAWLDAWADTLAIRDADGGDLLSDDVGAGPTFVSGDLVLPKKLPGAAWSQVSWNSNDAAVRVEGDGGADYAGVVAVTSTDRVVTLTARVGLVALPNDDALAVERGFTLIVRGNPEVVEAERAALQARLDAAFDYARLSYLHGPAIPAGGRGLTADVQLPIPRDVGVDGKYYAMTYEAGNKISYLATNGSSFQVSGTGVPFVPNLSTFVPNLQKSRDTGPVSVDTVWPTTEYEVAAAGSLAVSGGTGAGEAALEVSGYRANVARPLPGEAEALVSLTCTVTLREQPEVTASRTLVFSVAPLADSELDEAADLMARAKAGLAEALLDGQAAGAVTRDLRVVQRAWLDGDGTLAWADDWREAGAHLGVAPVALPGYDALGPSGQARLFRSSRPAIVSNETLHVRPGVYNAEVTVTARLSDQRFELLARRHPDDLRLARLVDQDVSVAVTVPGTTGLDDPNAERAVQASVRVVGPGADGVACDWVSGLVASAPRGSDVLAATRSALAAAGLAAEFEGSVLTSVVSPITGERLANVDGGAYWQLWVDGVYSPAFGDGVYLDGDGADDGVRQVVWRYAADRTGELGLGPSAIVTTFDATPHVDGATDDTPTFAARDGWAVGGVSMRAGSVSVSEPVVVGGKVVVASGTSLVVVDAADGEGRSVVAGALEAPISSTCRPLYADGMIYVPLTGGRIAAVEAGAGERPAVAWTSEAPHDAGATEQATCSMALVEVDGRRLLVTGTAEMSGGTAVAGTLVVVDANAGEVVYSSHLNDAGYYWGGATLAGGRIAIGDTAGRLHLLEHLDPDGWRETVVPLAGVAEGAEVSTAAAADAGLSVDTVSAGADVTDATLAQAAGVGTASAAGADPATADEATVMAPAGMTGAGAGPGTFLIAPCADTTHTLTADVIAADGVGGITTATAAVALPADASDAPGPDGTSAINAGVVAWGDSLLVTTRDGTLHRVTLDESSGIARLADSVHVGAGCTAEPVVVASRWAVCATCGPEAADGESSLAVVDLAAPGGMRVVHRVTRADGTALPAGGVKAAPLVSVQGDSAWCYFATNDATGQVFVWRMGLDGTGADEAARFYVPSAGHKNHCDSPLVCDAGGSLYYLNDSGYVTRLAASDVRPGAQGGSGSVDGSGGGSHSAGGSARGAGAGAGSRTGGGTSSGGLVGLLGGARIALSGNSGGTSIRHATATPRATLAPTAQTSARAPRTRDERAGQSVRTGADGGRPMAGSATDKHAGATATATSGAGGIPIWPVLGLVGGIVGLTATLLWRRRPAR